MKVITESGMNFGKFEDADIFHIENSKIYKDLGTGIKTVEFVLKYNENSVIFLEAKKSCPNAANRYESTSDLGTKLQNVTSMQDIQLKFILVVKNAKDISWLAGPLAELKARLRKMRKIWNVEIAVLNEELAAEHKLICQK